MGGWGWEYITYAGNSEVIWWISDFFPIFDNLLSRKKANHGAKRATVWALEVITSCMRSTFTF